MTKYHSTNYGTPRVDFKTAVLTGQALDKGLYMLDKIPKLTKEAINNFKNLALNDIGFEVISKFIDDSISDHDLKIIIKDALNFDIPIEKIHQNDFICYLDQGPTASFKDFGARTLARIMEYFLKVDDKDIIILTATSGDTGGAVAQAFFDIKRIKVIVLFPKDEISELQRKQMTTLGKNITAIGIEGKFDDCQRLVKMAFNDPDLKEFGLSSANSINVGRLIPQTIYYFYSYSRIIEEMDEEVIFSVPSGNFGNLMGGLIAYNMGIPVRRFISAVNENDAFPKFLKSGVYEKIEPSKKCISNAMNVGHPSNFARIIDLYDGQIDETGVIHKNPVLHKLREDIISYSITDELTEETIIDFYKKHNKIIEPHGAVGWASLEMYRNEFLEDDKYKSICFETADPAKFPNEIMSLINITPNIPKSLRTIQNKKEIHESIEISTYKDFKFLIQNKI
ncbi:MAG: threonine synthase [Promethearchaeota archaeon]|jgi:threonine synthase